MNKKKGQVIKNPKNFDDYEDEYDNEIFEEASKKF
jgi:hypothetical protein